MNKTFSQASQDLFAAYVVGRNGFFLDIGCREPISENNSYLLETEFGWKGIMIDMDAAAIERCKAMRKAVCLAMDVVQQPISLHVIPMCPNVIDYVSFDVDRANEFVINDFPWLSHQIRCFTFEHNRYLPHEYGDLVNRSRVLFRNAGYHLLCADVIMPGAGSFEDWYVKPELVDMFKCEEIACRDKVHSEIFYGLSISG